MQRDKATNWALCKILKQDPNIRNTYLLFLTTGGVVIAVGFSFLGTGRLDTLQEEGKSTNSVRRKIIAVQFLHKSERDIIKTSRCKKTSSSDLWLVKWCISLPAWLSRDRLLALARSCCSFAIPPWCDYVRWDLCRGVFCDIWSRVDVKNRHAKWTFFFFLNGF